MIPNNSSDKIDRTNRIKNNYNLSSPKSLVIESPTLKISILSVLFILIHTAAFSQDNVRIFKTKSDSIAFAQNEYALRHLNPGLIKNNTRDSLLQVRYDIIQRGFLGWHGIYRPDPDFTSLAEIDNNEIDPTKVWRLSISDYPLRRLPAVIYNCKNLEALELVNTQITRLPRRLNRLSKLKVLYVYNNQSPRTLKLSGNKHISYLKIRSNTPDQTPSGYRRLRGLDSLDLARNFLTEFPDISRNHSLQKLVLNDNNLTLENMVHRPSKSLEVLHLRGNKIEVVPRILGQYSNLKDLSLNNNNIREIDEGISNLKKLEELSLYHNQLTAIPPCLYTLVNLREVDLYFNLIEKIDDKIAALSKLEVLYLANNKLYSLSENLGTLPNLRRLYIHHNRISYLPNSLGNHTTLEVLSMNDNFFAEFPNQILQLVNVEYLNISRNRIQRIPGALNNLDALTLLVMTENPWEDWSAIDELVLILRSRGVYVHVSPRDETAEDY